MSYVSCIKNDNDDDNSNNTIKSLKPFFKH